MRRGWHGKARVPPESQSFPLFLRTGGCVYFATTEPEAGRMKPKLVLSDVKRPIVVEVSAEVKGSQFDDGFGH
jgi:hypothetical protein